MGQSFLQTFDELITAEMSPEASFTVWQVDNVGDIISSSMNVIIHSHEKARVCKRKNQNSFQLVS